MKKKISLLGLVLILVLSFTGCSKSDTADYDAAKDITFYAERPEGFVKVRKGMFALFFPQDAHAPGVTSTALCKAVFKLPLQTK